MFEVLKENGYHQSLMVGSDADFGGRETYYKTHGVDQIYDIYTARRAGIVPSNYFVWWGMEDLHLFDYAKQELTKIAAQEQPFAFSMLTVDTHHIGGYTCSLCGSNYEESYENAIACSSRQVDAFVQWLQNQDFYENTTVIITGDHCSMDKGYFSRNVDENYTRHVYNCFLNAPVATENTKNRQFSALDMFPTTLAAMGCTIEGDRLGLGTNLFSDTPTLIEDLGYYAFSNELQKRAPFYNRFYGEDAVTATKNAVS
jgi:phosphoglycerol transferase